ncbi:MAG: TetR/AcrR family transcriptional regulator [Paracoccus sp. (in: a-proteobacteria)]|nr:TetR/AcrR family transcriptional regulator [Paracoccus sp. (in: a-proteobacteria)]
MAGIKDKDAIYRGRKYEQVRDGAVQIFLRDGYAGANVDDIARAARVSKATLYAYFPDKKLMFAEVMACRIKAVFVAPPFNPDICGSTADRLYRLLLQLGKWLAQPDVCLMRRTILTEAGRFPDLARSFITTENRLVLQPLAKCLESWASTGQIINADPKKLARQIHALLSGEIQQASASRLPAPLSHAVIAELVDDAAALILRAHVPAASKPEKAPAGANRVQG